MERNYGFRRDLLPNNPTCTRATVTNVNASNNIRPPPVPPTHKEVHCWSRWSAGQAAPPNALLGGRDVDGTPIFVGRAHHKGDLIPAKVMPDKKVAYIPWGGKEIAKSACEVLCQQNLRWIPSGGGAVPPGAFPVGHTSNGETLYAARVDHEGSQTVGKVHPSHRTCYISFGGKEIAHKNYEILVLKNTY